MKYSQLGKPASLLLFAFVSASSIASGWTFQTLDSTGYVNARVESISGGRAYGFGFMSGFGTHALSWDLTTGSRFVHHPSGSNGSLIYGAKDGTAVGVSNGVAVAWDGLTNTAMNLNPSGWSNSRIFGTDGSTHVGSVGWEYAALWDAQNGNYTNLHPSGYRWSIAASTSMGRQVGYAQNSAFQDRAGWWSGTSSSWQEFGGAATSSRAEGIDGAWVVGGERFGSGEMQAVLWNLDSGTKTNLNPAGSFGSYANAVSSAYQVGWAVGGAAFWNGTAESHVNLGAFAPSLHGSIAETVYISPSSIIVGGWIENWSTGRQQAAIWTKAVPEPGTLLAFALGGVFLRRKKK